MGFSSNIGKLVLARSPPVTTFSGNPCQQAWLGSPTLVGFGDESQEAPWMIRSADTNESIFYALDFSFPASEYMFLDLKGKLSKCFSKNLKMETHRVSRGWRKEPGPSLWPMTRRVLWGLGGAGAGSGSFFVSAMVTCLSRVVLLSACTVLKFCHFCLKS